MKIFSNIHFCTAQNYSKVRIVATAPTGVRKDKHQLESTVMTLKQCLEHIILICFMLFSICVSQANAVENEADILEPEIPLTIERNPDKEFKYVFEGRPDPFAPFISDKTVEAAQSDEIIEENIELIGMRQFEPGQLTLVAVLDADEVKIAMVEDVTGKGYIVNEGTPIGRRGIVSEIKKEEIIITETAHTRSGRKLTNKITMRLNKEGDN